MQLRIKRFLSVLTNLSKERETIDMQIPSELLSADPLKEIIKEDLGEEYLSDLWFIDFVTSCLSIFGAPAGLQGCLNIEDEIYYTYCVSVLIMTIKEMQQQWENLRNDSAESAAYSFADYYQKSRGSSLIPPYSYIDALSEGRSYERTD